MKTKTKFRMLTTAMVLILSIIFQTANAQETRSYVKSFDLGSYCVGYITFDATFTNIANAMHVKNAQLYITKGEENAMKAIESQGISKKYYDEIGTNAYKIDHFSLLMQGYATIGEGYNATLSDNKFNLQIDNTLGDFASLEFNNLDRNLYKNANSWVNSGDISDYQFRIMSLSFYDYRIREK